MRYPITPAGDQELIKIAEQAGLDPARIPADDFTVDGNIIHYRYAIFDNDSGDVQYSPDGRLRTTDWLTATRGVE